MIMSSIGEPWPSVLAKAPTSILITVDALVILYIAHFSSLLTSKCGILLKWLFIFSFLTLSQYFYRPLLHVSSRSSAAKQSRCRVGCSPTEPLILYSALRRLCTCSFPGSIHFQSTSYKKMNNRVLSQPPAPSKPTTTTQLTAPSKQPATSE
jgi:hypothetical protein